MITIAFLGHFVSLPALAAWAEHFYKSQTKFGRDITLADLCAQR